MNIFNAAKCPLDGKVFIEASAGTGKTFSIGLLTIRLLIEKLMPIEKIALITFTEKAAKELKKKTAEKIAETVENWTGDDIRAKANLQDALARIDEMPVFTIHGFCQKILTEFTFETDCVPNLEITTNDAKIVERLAADYWRKNIKNENFDVDMELADLIKAANEMLKHQKAKIVGEILENVKSKNYKKDSDYKKAKKYAVVCDFAKTVIEKFTEETKKERVLTFNDMIKNTYNAIKGEKSKILKCAIQKRYDAIFVDEFQDTDKMQFEIFDFLFEGRPFFMIGDPKQAIYKFRGGDIFAYLEAKNKVSADKQFTMDTNYRSEKTLIESLDYFFTKTAMTNNAMGEGINYTKITCGKDELKPICEIDDKYKKPLVIWRSEGQIEGGVDAFNLKVKNTVAFEIARLLNSKKIKPKQIAILTAKNSQMQVYKNALAKLRIPAVVKGASVFESEAAFFIRILLKAICFPNRIKYINALITHKFINYEPKEITEELADKWVFECYECRYKSERYGVAKAIDSFLSGNFLWLKIAKSENGKRHITNIRQIIEVLIKEEFVFGKVAERICQRFDELCSGKFWNGDSSQEEKLETDEDAVQIMTIHKSKGLEFDIVFVPDIGKSPNFHKFPEPYIYHKDNEIIDFSSESETAKELAKKEDNNEIARLLYVAMTRAKYRLYVAFASPKINKDGSISKANGATSACREIFDFYCKNDGEAHEFSSDFSVSSETEFGNLEHSVEMRDDNVNEEIKIFNGIIERSWQTASFSVIEKDIQTKEEFSHKGKAEKFPSGVRAGTILHSIFEDVEFDNSDNYSETVDEKLKSFSQSVISDEQREWAKEQVQIVLEKELADGIKLCDLPKGQKIAELEFQMSIDKIDVSAIANFFKNKAEYFASDKANRIAEQASNYDEANVIKTYLKGFIDLVFQTKDGKYYIVDWKSNFLGNEQSDYSSNSMENEMLKHKYHLQYYIYAMALIGYLKKIKSDFNYEKDFGGIFYIFLRGVNNENKNGIYFDKPTENELEEFRMIFEKGT